MLHKCVPNDHEVRSGLANRAQFIYNKMKSLLSVHSVTFCWLCPIALSS